MKIKRFNENAENKMFDPRFIEKDGEIWMNKKDFQDYYAWLLREFKKIEAPSTKESAISHVIKNLKSKIDDVGGNPKRIVDPYNEEDWDE